MLNMVVTTDNGGGPWDSNTPLRGTKVYLCDVFDVYAPVCDFE